ncbi:MAG: radical SAM protein [Dehalococcoidaceae bacterium]|nr:radical SAM protein [Dehalococcoidaceae bacterium]
MRVYHLAYDASAASLDVHFWTACSLHCRACYVAYNPLDFGLFDDPIAELSKTKILCPDSAYLSPDQVMGLIKDLPVKSAVFVGTEPSLDPELPELARLLHNNKGSYNILLTNAFQLADMSDIDELIVSIKAFDRQKHLEYTGVDNIRILDNFKSIYCRRKKMQAETVYIPGFIEMDEIERIAAFIGEIDPAIPLRIDAFFTVPGVKWRSATADEVEAAAERARAYLQKVNCLTLEMKRIGEKVIRVY